MSDINCKDNGPRRPMRFQSIDVLRGFGVFLVILSHGAHYWANHVYNVGFYALLVLIPAGAPIFMVLAGVSVVLLADSLRLKGRSEKEVQNHILRRGIFLIAFGYLYNLIAESTIYYLWANYPYNPNSAIFAIYANTTFFDWISLFGIFHIIGLGFIVAFFVMKLSYKQKAILVAICVVITSIATYGPMIFGQLPFKLYVADWHYYPRAHPLLMLTDMLFYGQYPVFPWIMYFIMGSAIGSFLIENVEKGTLQNFSNKHHKIVFNMAFITTFPLFGNVILMGIFPGMIPLEPSLWVIFSTGMIMILMNHLINRYEMRGETHKKIDLTLGMWGKFSMDIYALTGILMVDVFLIIGRIINVPLLGNLDLWFVIILIVAYMGLYILITNLWYKKKFKYSINWLQRKCAG